MIIERTGNGGAIRLLEKPDCESAIREYIESGKADELIRARAAKLQDVPRCDHCKHWDGQTMMCTLHGETMQGCQRSKYFGEGVEYYLTPEEEEEEQRRRWEDE